jgi:hypothetical protein
LGHPWEGAHQPLIWELKRQPQGYRPCLKVLKLIAEIAHSCKIRPMPKEKCLCFGCNYFNSCGSILSSWPDISSCSLIDLYSTKDRETNYLSLITSMFWEDKILLKNITGSFNYWPEDPDLVSDGVWIRNQIRTQMCVLLPPSYLALTEITFHNLLFRTQSITAKPWIPFHCPTSFQSQDLEPCIHLIGFLCSGAAQCTHSKLTCKSFS